MRRYSYFIYLSQLFYCTENVNRKLVCSLLNPGYLNLYTVCKTWINEQRQNRQKYIYYKWGQNQVMVNLFSINTLNINFLLLIGCIFCEYLYDYLYMRVYIWNIFLKRHPISLHWQGFILVATSPPRWTLVFIKLTLIRY